MAAGDSDSVNGLLPQLIRHLAKLARLELPESVGGIDAVEQRGLGGNSHAMLLNTDKRRPTNG
jgi:hypothetical protein